MKFLKKIGKGLSSAWKWMDGKKTKFGGVITGVTLIVSGLTPINPNIVTGILILSGTLTGVGAGHKVVKNKDSITSAFTRTKK